MAKFNAAGMRVDGKNGQRDGEDRTSREVGVLMWGQPPSAVRRAKLDSTHLESGAPASRAANSGL
jgi:hypothetical protein